MRTSLPGEKPPTAADVFERTIKMWRDLGTFLCETVDRSAELSAAFCNVCLSRHEHCSCGGASPSAPDPAAVLEAAREVVRSAQLRLKQGRGSAAEIALERAVRGRVFGGGR